MRRYLTDRRGQGGLVLWVILSSGLAIRDLWLAAHGGGVTPSWLLRGEAAAFSMSAISGLAALTSPPRSTGRAGSETLKAATAVGGVAAVVMHVVRLEIYLSQRGTEPRGWFGWRGMAAPITRSCALASPRRR